MRTQRLVTLLVPLVLVVLVAMGCSPTAAPPATGTPTAAATATASPAATSPPPSPTAVSPATPAAGAPAIEAARGALAQRYDVPVSTISVVASEAVQWPDSCLGVNVPGIACAFHVVDGYRVVLEINGLQYEYHTNGDGSEVVAALALTWHREGGIAGFCNDLVIDVTGGATAFSCKSGPAAQVSRQLLSVEMRQQLDTWRQGLSPFETVAGDGAVADALTVTLSFVGYGTVQATPNDENAIGQFAGAVYADIGGLQGTSSAADAAGQVVDAFLKALMSDPTGLSSLQYLTGAVTREIEAGTPVSELLGIEGMYRSYGIQTSTIEPIAGRAFVEVGLNFVSPIPRAFELTLEGDVWQINTLIVYGVPEQVLPADIKAADLALLDFVWDLQTEDLPAAALLLTANGQAQLGDLARLSEGAGNLVAPSLRLTALSGDQAVYEAALLIESATSPPAWQNGLNQRWFLLQKTDAGWQIDQMSENEIAVR